MNVQIKLSSTTIEDVIKNPAMIITAGLSYYYLSLIK
jgi:hypothetical protein